LITDQNMWYNAKVEQEAGQLFIAVMLFERFLV